MKIESLKQLRVAQLKEIKKKKQQFNQNFMKFFNE